MINVTHKDASEEMTRGTWSEHVTEQFIKDTDKVIPPVDWLVTFIIWLGIPNLRKMHILWTVSWHISKIHSSPALSHENYLAVIWGVKRLQRSHNRHWERRVCSETFGIWYSCRIVEATECLSVTRNCTKPAEFQSRWFIRNVTLKNWTGEDGARGQHKKH